MSLLQTPDFGLLFDALPAPHLALTPDLTVAAANPAMCAWLAQEAAQLRGAPAHTALPLAAGSPEWAQVLRELPAATEHLVTLQTPAGTLRQLCLRPVFEPGTTALRYILAQPADQPASPSREQPQEQFRSLSEFIPQLVWTTNAHGQPDYFNQRWRDYTGHAGLAAPDTAWLSQLHPAEQAAARQRWTQALSTGAPYRTEARIRDQHGRHRWFLIQALPLRDAQGHLSQWLGTCTDIDDAKRVHQRLQAKDRQLQQVLGQVPAYVATLFGQEHICSFATPNFIALLEGRLRVGWPMAQTLPELATQGVLTLLDETYRTGRTTVQQDFALEWVAVDGSVRQRYVDLTLQPLRHELGPVQGVLFFAVDVTPRVLARKHNERLAAAVRRRNAQVRTMTEALPLISYIQAPTGKVLYVSPQWNAFTGQPAATARGGLGWRGSVHPDDHGPLTAAFARARREQRAWSAELRLRAADGQYRWHQTRSLPMFDERGRLSRWYGSLIDVHEQRELTEQLQRSEQQFRFLADSIPQLVWTLAPDGTPEFLNEGWLSYTGLGVDDIRQHGWSTLVAPDEQAEAQRVMTDHIRLGLPHEHENRLRRAADGQYRWHLHRARPMHDAAGRIVRWFGTSTDVDDYKRFQHELETRNAELMRINQDLDNFVYTASHDLKQPIDNMASIFQELARTARYDDPDAPALVTMFEHSIEQLYITIQELAALVQVQKRNLEVTPEEVRLERLAQEVLHSIGEQIRTAGAVVETDFEAVPAVEFVRPNLQSVLYNLLSNAVKYADPQRPARIRVWTELDAAGAPVLGVQDNGLGIDLARHGKDLFQLFRRFHDHVKGSGTGLYLVQRLVQAHGGRIDVQSAVGEGTTFRVQLGPGSGPGQVSIP